jgi:glycosyltransferase involved in cell wall biosynthesis
MNRHQNTALMVAFNYPPSATAGVHRTLRFTRFLGQTGWQSCVLTCAPNQDTRLDSKLADMIPAEVSVNHVALSRPEERQNQTRSAKGPAVEQHSSAGEDVATNPRVPGLRQQVKELLFAIPDDRIGWKKAAVSRGLELVRQHHIAVVYATAPPFTTLLVGREIARKAGLPLVLDFRDPWTRVPWGPRNKSSLANRWAARLERLCVSSASAVILNTAELKDDFIQFYNRMPPQKFIAIPNGYDPDVRNRIENLPAATPRPADSQQPRRLLHPGSMYRNRDPRPIVDAIALLKEQGINVILEQVGYCDANFDLAAYANARNVSDLIHIKPAIAHHEMLQYMSEVDAFLLLQPGTGLQIPGKLFEMILYRKPILALCVPGAVANVIQRYNIGTIADADNAAQIAVAIRKLFDHAIASENWDSIIADFDGRYLTQQLADVFNSVISSAQSLDNLHD